MKKLHHNEVARHFEMFHLTKCRWDLLPVVYELQGHDRVTIDMQPNFGGISKTFKECRKSGHAFDSLKVWKIEQASNRRTLVPMNPNYI